jgi:hypothetical protein
MRVTRDQVRRVSRIGLGVALGVLMAGILAAGWNAPGTRPIAVTTSVAPKSKPVNAASGTLLPIQGTPCVTAPSGMISWWPGDDNANDIQDGNNGTLVGGTTFAAGKVGPAFRLDGVDDFIDVPDADNLDVSSQVTIDAWVNPTALGGTIVDKMTPGGADGYKLDTFGGVVRFVFDGQEVSGSTPLAAGTFTHVSATYDFDSLKVYVNGVLDGTFVAEEIALAPNNLPFRIGADQNGANNFSGLIDEVEIFDHALTGAELLSIVNAGSAGKCRASCVLTCPTNIVQPNDFGQCGAVVDFTPTSSACGTVTCSPPSGSFFAVGSHDVTCTASVDPTTCNFNVTVNDTEPPIMNCDSITKPTDPNLCTAVVNYAPSLATDNCPGVTVVCTPPSGSTFSVGTTNVSCTATDAASNTSMCDFTVTVGDTRPPTLTPCPPDMNFGTTAPCQNVTYTTPTATSACGEATVTCDPPSGFCFPVGMTTVTCTASDDSPFSPDAMCTFKVTVDSCALICPANITASTAPNQCSAVVTFGFTTPPACGTPACSPASGSSFSKGTTTVNCSTPGDNCSFTVTVNDTQPPTLTPCPPDMNVTTLAACQAVTYTPPTATDNCGAATVSCAPPSGFCFPLGTTTVTCTASDDSPDSPDAMCSFTVSVASCSLTCPANITASTAPNQCSAVVTFDVTTPPACGTVMCSPASGSSFPKGTTTVNCSSSGGGTCSFAVTVNDTQAPTLTPCPANMSFVTPGTCQVVTYTPPTATDNCGTATVSCTPPSGFCFPVGTTTVTCTASDTSPDSPDATCSFTVSVSCAITCPGNITATNAQNQCGAVVTFNITIPPVCGPVMCTPASGAFFPTGTTTVNCSTSGGVTCNFMVTVNDTQPPVITCPSDITTAAALTCPPATTSGPVNFTVIASDNCPGVTTACKNQNNQVVTPGSTFPVGTTAVTCTATDASGNTATCGFSVTVFSGCLQDETDPTTVVLFNTQTGEYRFCCGGTIFGGTGIVTAKGCMVTIQHSAPDSRVQISTDGNSGTASLQSPPGTIRCTILDRNVRNNSCDCE